MNNVIMALGGLLFVVGAVTFGVEQRTSRRIEVRTRGRADSLTGVEVWLSTRVFEKRRKLRDLANTDPDETLRKEANAALRLAALAWMFCFFGLLTLWVGASAS